MIGREFLRYHDWVIHLETIFIFQSYLQQEGAPTYDKEERLKKNLKDGFQNQRYGLLKDEL